LFGWQVVVKSDLKCWCGTPILEHTAGRCLDAMLAEMCFGWRWFSRVGEVWKHTKWLLWPDTETGTVVTKRGPIGPLILTNPPDNRMERITYDSYAPKYSEDFALAFQDIVEEHEPNGGKRWYYTLEQAIVQGWTVKVYDELHLKYTDVDVYGDTLPLAIVKARLLVQELMDKEKQT